MRQGTAADQQRYLRDGFVPVDCTRCGSRVRVRKHSADQTSIQWSTSPARSCAEYPVEGTSVFEGCSTLKASIADAVADGRVTVTGV
jgi:hypothetical protein